jgi:tryptophan synthase beta chain
MKAHFLQDEVGQVVEAESISAGLDYPGVGPEHSNLADMGRAEYYPVTDDMVVDAFQILSKREGIIPALESAHAIAWVIENAEELAGKNVLVNLSGRGDKDVAQVRERLGE